MLRPALSTSFALVLVPSLAHAQNVGVAPVQAPPAQTTAPAPTSGPAAQPDRTPEAAHAKSDLTGFAFGLGFDVLIPGGAIASGVDMGDFFGVQSGASLMLQGYAHKNFGLLFGVRASFDSTGGDLCNNECKGYSFQVPVLVEAAFKNRKEGFYLNAGAGFATRYAVSGGGVMLTARNDGPELKLGLGYRLVFNDARNVGLSFFGGLDHGAFNYLEISGGGNGTTSGAIASSRTAAHNTFELGAQVSWY
jgi:hypothetical protein